MENKIIEIEAETLEEAREQVRSQIPGGFDLLSEEVIADGKPKTVRAVADTIEAAFAKAQSEIPPNAVIIEKKEIIHPAQRVMTVEAFDEQNARTQLQSRIGETETIKSLRLGLTGKKGFLGIVNKPNQYESQVFQQAIVEITYKAKARISAKIGKLIAIKDGYSYARDRLKSHMSMSSGTQKTMEVLDDVIRVIDDYAYFGNRIAAWNFLEMTQYLSETRSQGLGSVIMAQKETRMMRVILAGLKKLVLIKDCGVAEKEIPDDVDEILRLRGPGEVDKVIEYLSGVGLA